MLLPILPPCSALRLQLQDELGKPVAMTNEQAILRRRAVDWSRLDLPRRHRTIRGRKLNGQTYDDYPEVAGKEPPTRRIRLQLLDELGSV
jgi:hypothetical protein